jgi:hypothetical protein
MEGCMRLDEFVKSHQIEDYIRMADTDKNKVNLLRESRGNELV